MSLKLHVPRNTQSTVRPRSGVLLAFAIISVIVIAIAAAVFKPWLLFQNIEVNDTIPEVTNSAAPPSNSSGQNAEKTTSQSKKAENNQQTSATRDLSVGEFVSHEHATKGIARIVQVDGGQHKLVLQNLNTSNGPDVHVWLSHGDVVEGFDGWTSAGKHERVDLGSIKGNKGNQVYDIPAGTNLGKIHSVDLWCDQFNVSFGAAPVAIPS